MLAVAANQEPDPPTAPTRKVFPLDTVRHARTKMLATFMV
jgi:hypothetical protein